jgi:D-aminopeptidase
MSRPEPRRIFIMTDIEGVAGVTSFKDQTFGDGRYHDHAKRLLTAEVNAAVEALLEGGVEEVLVADGHGPGGSGLRTSMKRQSSSTADPLRSANC